MTNSPTSTPSRKQSVLARLTALLLLALVVYATTAATIHQHGGLRGNRTTNSSPLVTSTTESAPSLNDSLIVGSCLICQLHQNLSNGLIGVEQALPAPQGEARQTTVLTLCYALTDDSPQRGRAPPATSLS